MLAGILSTTCDRALLMVMVVAVVVKAETANLRAEIACLSKRAAADAAEVRTDPRVTTRH